MERVIGIEDEVPFANKGTLPAIRHAPIYKESALVFLRGRGGGVIDAEISNVIAAKALLNFPARQVCVNKDITCG